MVAPSAPLRVAAKLFAQLELLRVQQRPQHIAVSGFRVIFLDVVDELRAFRSGGSAGERGEVHLVDNLGRRLTRLLPARAAACGIRQVLFEPKESFRMRVPTCVTGAGFEVIELAPGVDYADVAANTAAPITGARNHVRSFDARASSLLDPAHESSLP